MRSSSLGWLVSKGVREVLDRVMVGLGMPPRHPYEHDLPIQAAGRIVDRALGWIDRQGERPFLAFLNLMDAHDPYLPASGEPPKFGPGPRTLEEWRTLRGWLHLDRRGLTPEQVRMARGVYASNVAVLDREVGRLADELHRRGLLDGTVLVVTADHGEHFGEHERDGAPLYGHRLSVFQAEVHVPLLVRAPERVPAGAVVYAAASLRDLPATVMGLVSPAEAAGPFPGASLERFWRGGAEADPAALAEFVFLPRSTPDRRYVETEPGLMRAVVTGERAYHRGDGDREALYDLAVDPGEHRDVAGDPAWRGVLEADRRRMEELFGGRVGDDFNKPKAK
jgi:arylsulfatase A-like enzyme